MIEAQDTKPRLRRSNGRPPKPSAQKLTKVLRLRLTEDEYQNVIGRAQELNLTLAEYCRKAIFATEITRPFTEEELDLKRKLVGIANNLNQLAYQANVSGLEKIESDCKHILAEIKKELHVFRR